MKLPSLRGLFASVASAAILAGSLAGTYLPAQAAPSNSDNKAQENKSQENKLVVGAVPSINSQIKLHEHVSPDTARAVMKKEGWELMLYGFAYSAPDTVGSTLALYRQPQTNNWRIVHYGEKEAEVAYEGTGLKLSEPKNPYAKLASAGADEIFNVQAQSKPVPVNHPHVGVQQCGPALASGEGKALGTSVVAEGIFNNGGGMITITANYMGDQQKNPQTWAMYMTSAKNTSVDCRVELGYGFVLAESFAQKPPGYTPPQMS